MRLAIVSVIIGILLFWIPASSYAQMEVDWIRIFTSQSGNSDEILDVATDANDNIYVTGCVEQRMAIIKLNSAGDSLWSSILGSPWGMGYRLGFDLSFNPIVAGCSTTDSTAQDFMTIKCNSQGSIIWSAQKDGLASLNDGATIIVTDTSGDIFVCGPSVKDSWDTDIMTVKYDRFGNELWTSVYDSGGYANSNALSIERNGIIYIAGTSWNDYWGRRALLISLMPDGSLKYRSYIPNMAILMDIKSDDNGALYMAAHGGGFGIVKCDTSANVLWSRILPTSQGGAYDIELTSTGYLYAVGYDYLVKYDTAGDQIWSYPLGTAIGYQLRIERDGNVVIYGEDQAQAFIARVSPDGNLLWQDRYHPEGYNGIRGYRFALLSDGDIITTGYSYGQNQDNTIFVRKYYNFIAGDANGSRSLNGLDVVFIVSFLKGFGPPPHPFLLGDSNGDCYMNGLDVVYLVNYLKGLGPAPMRCGH